MLANGDQKTHFGPQRGSSFFRAYPIKKPILLKKAGLTWGTLLTIPTNFAENFILLGKMQVSWKRKIDGDLHLKSELFCRPSSRLPRIANI